MSDRYIYRPEKMQPAGAGVVEAVWAQVAARAQAEAAREPHMAGLLEEVVLRHDGLAAALATRIAQRLSGPDFPREALESLINYVLCRYPREVVAMATDLCAVVQRDPASSGTPLAPLLFFKGFHALCAHRIAHVLWGEGRELPALLLQSMCSEVFGIDIHPAARMGCGILLDHGTGIVIGETAIVENDVSMLHEVTLGGTGKELCDRHPVVRSGVLIGAGAKVLGRVEIGEGAKVAASSVVLDDVRPHTTVAGVPAVEVGRPAQEAPAFGMQQAIR